MGFKLLFGDFKGNKKLKLVGEDDKEIVMKGGFEAKSVRVIKGKEFVLSKFVFDNREAAETTAKRLKTIKQIKDVAVVKEKNVFFVYVRVSN